MVTYKERIQELGTARNEEREKAGLRKLGKPKGSKNKYTVSNAVMHQRSVAALKHGEQSKIMQEVVNKMELTPEQTELLAQERLTTWKKLSTPALFIADQFIELKTLVDAKLLKGMDPTSKDYREMMKLYLEFIKEYNRLTQVSADKKMEAFSRSFSQSDEIVIDMKEEERKDG